jgi:2-hydroxychromene-2-carboxylate isomerase
MNEEPKAGVDGEKRVPTIDFWFEFGSNYSYLSVMRIEAEAARTGVKVRWRPFLLGPVFRALGWETSPFVLQKEKGAYVWKDMVRQCQKYGLRWTQPSVFPRTALLPLRVALVGAEQPWMGDYCRRIMAANFVDDREIDSRDLVEQTLVEMGLPATSILLEAQSGPNRVRLRDETDAAKALGIFGAPTFFVEGEMFWGNDRLDDALVIAARGQA